MTNPILTAALELHSLGYSVIPIRADGSKAPALNSWKQYTQTLPTIEDLHSWYPPASTFGLGIIQGAISGNAELTEVEGRAIGLLPDLAQLARDTGLGDLWDRITTGWLEGSPSGGLHFHYRLSDMAVPGNQKIARGADKQVLAETRGTGGQVVAAPTGGNCHPTGKPWVRILGGPATAPLITADEREAFHAILATLDHTPEQPTAAPTMPSAPRNPDDGISPLDDYEAKTDWADILIPAGWTLATTRGNTRYWTRPGKSWGFSATTGHADDRDRLFVFTSSTEFAQEIPYTKPGAYALLNFGGNHNAAATDLARQGYGQRRQHPRVTNEGPDTFFNDILGDQPWPNTNQTNPAPTAPATNAGSGSATANATSSINPSPTTGPNPSDQAPTETITNYTREPTHYSATDDGNALRLIDDNRETIRYCPQKAAWLKWNGHTWKWDDAGTIHELSRGISRDLPSEFKDEIAHQKHSLSRSGLSAIEKIARTDPRIVAHLDTLDADPYELNTPSGVISLRTGEISTPNPAKLHTRSTTVGFDPIMPTPKWTKFLADTFAGDPHLTTYVQRLLGVSFVGEVLEQVLPFAFGSGANGKSVLFETVQKIAGIGPNGYAASIPADMLVQRAREDHPATIAQLSGVRIAIGGELEQGAKFAEAKVKALTGGDPINARFMGQNPFTFVPTHTLWLHANHQPEVRTGGPAFWRRLRQIPFVHTVPEKDRIEGLEDILIQEEGPGILAWLIQGSADYFANGLTIPASVAAATEAYQQSTDTIAQFVEDRCQLGDANAQHMHVRVTDLRAAYEVWCREEGFEAVSARGITQQLRARFGVLSEKKSAGVRYYDGIRLVETEEPTNDREEWYQK